MEKVATWFLIFMFYSFAGWLMEVCVGILQRHKVVNRGFLVGPICPIYGSGALILSFVLREPENPFVIFCVAVVGSAILEYVVSYMMEKLFRVRWWDYTNRAFNLNGRICLESVVSFGVIGVLILKFINPWLLSIIGGLPTSFMIALAIILFVWVIFDIALSLWLIVGVRVTVGTMQADATEEISQHVQEILSGTNNSQSKKNNKLKGKLNRRLEKAFPNQTPSQKKPRTKSKSTKKSKS